MRRQAGFTLLELILVVAIGAILMRVVTANIGAIVPSKAMDSAAGQLISQANFLRSEARLQGKVYRLEMDLDNHRFRTVLPPEDRLLSTEEQQEEFALGWTQLEDGVQFERHEFSGGRLVRNGLSSIEFDAGGFTGDQTIVLVYETDEKMLWSVQLRGLTGTSSVQNDFDGKIHLVETADASSF